VSSFFSSFCSANRQTNWHRNNSSFVEHVANTQIIRTVSMLLLLLMIMMMMTLLLLLLAPLLQQQLQQLLLCQSVSSVASRQHLRSASRGLLVVPHQRLSSYGRRAFSVASPTIWNWLPDSLRDPAISRDSFKRSLKTFLFSAYSCT